MPNPEETRSKELPVEEVMAVVKTALKEVAAVWLHSDTTKKHAAILVEVEGQGIFNFVAEVEDVIIELETIAPGVPDTLKAVLRDNIPGGGPHRLSVYMNTLKGTGVAQIGAALIAVQPMAAAADLN